MSKLILKKKGKMYECAAFFSEGHPKRWKYVKDLKSFAAFLSKSHHGWKYFNVYEKGTKAYLKRFYPDNPVPKVLPLLLLACVSLLTSKCTFKKQPAQAATPMKNTSRIAAAGTTTYGIYNLSTNLTLAGRGLSL